MPTDRSVWVLPPGRDLLGDLGFRALLVLITVAAALFLLLPIVIVIGASFTASEFITFPPKGLSLRWFEKLLRSPEVMAATWTSIVVAGIATLMAVLLGAAAAFPLVRCRASWLELLGGAFLSPLIVPAVSYGLGVLLFLNATGVPLSFWPLTMAHIIVIAPYILRSTAAALQLSDLSLEDAATSLGANRRQVFWHIILPHLTPAIITGAAFAFLASFDNLTISLFLVGPRTETLPIRIYTLIEYDIDPVAAAISAVIALATLLLVLLLERVVGLSRVLKV
jgi:putative spermidine/putrescine transport system permease protein